MTPCQELGYQVGDVFIYHGNRPGLIGELFKLLRDDGTPIPVFTAVSYASERYPEGYKFVFSFDEIREIGLTFNE
jgi:hypothetical protein